MIRVATASDLPAMLGTARKFFVEGKLPMSLVDDVWVANWTAFINMGIGVVLMSEDAGVFHGAIGGLLVNDVNDGSKYLSEMFWYVDPEHRGTGMRLLHQFERAAKDHGATRITMVHLHAINERLGDIYTRLGYHKLETTYTKDLPAPV
jgi:GNAT superfamily N-acetyltransferase